MAKASESLKQLQAKVIKTIENLEVSEFFERIPDVIRDRTRNGYGISDENGKVVLLPKLAESTINRRISLDNNGELSSETTPFLSNLTESGKMLDAMRYRKVNKTHTITFDDRRTRNGKKPSEIRKFVEDKGFKFFGLAKVERDQLEKNVAQKMEKEIAKIFK